MNSAKRHNNLAKSLSLINAGFQRRIISIFAISSILPILIAFYLNYDQILGGSSRISLFLFIATVLSLLGLFLLIDIIKTLLREG